jgi:flagellar biosynthesis/type III secretory pathway M-ring protein FliF/YscJ
MASKLVEQSTQLVSSISKGHLFSLIAILLVAGIGFGSLIFWNTRPEYQVLFSNLSRRMPAHCAINSRRRKFYQVTPEWDGGSGPREHV